MTAHQPLLAPNDYSMGSVRAEDMLQKARDMQPVLRERAAQCKVDRKVPVETIEDFRKAGFFK